METANTGHLVFGTLHTATAVGPSRGYKCLPVFRVVKVRAALADSLKSRGADPLQANGQGRVAAMEILTINYAMQNMIRSDQTHQIASACRLVRGSEISCSTWSSPSARRDR